MILHCITYTIPAPAYGKNCRTECHARIVRRYELSEIGAERVIRRKLIEDGELSPEDDWDGRVIRIETWKSCGRNCFTK